MKFFEKNIYKHDLIDSERLRDAIENSETILRRNMVKYQSSYPSENSKQGIYSFEACFFDCWHPGIWCGMYWLMYELTEELPYKRYAETICGNFYELINNDSIWHSDIGILYLPMCMPDMFFNKSEAAKEALVLAADCLLTKYVDGEHLSVTVANSNNSNTAEKNYCFKISGLNNIQLLSTVTKITGNEKYSIVAENTLQKILQYNISPNGNVSFSSVFEGGNGKFIECNDDPEKIYGMNCYKGYARSHAWAIWGLALCYSLTGKEDILKNFEKVFNYINVYTRTDVCEYVFGKDDNEIYDSTSTAIILCGVLEMGEHINKNTQLYKNLMQTARKLLGGLLTRCATQPGDGKECLLERGFMLHSTHNEKSLCTSGTVAGDYFWLEALVRCYKKWKPFWY